MGKHIMKEAPDLDFYVEWSSIVESWTFAGSRADMLAHLGGSSRRPFGGDDRPEARLARTDATGTSSLWITNSHMRDRYPEEGSWEDTGTIYMQLGYLSRENIFKLVRRQITDPDAEVEDLLAPFEDGCRCRHEYASHASSDCSECSCLMRVSQT